MGNSTASDAPSQNDSPACGLNHMEREPTFDLCGVRQIVLTEAQSGCSCIIGAAAEYARIYFPRNSLARAA